ncbi:MAG: uridine kinase [Polyangiaceae bacterium]|nr:uridine kinase [Polyangiaceae bacterium]
MLFVGIAGGTGSGKTTLAERVTGALPPGSVALLSHDSYYRDQSHLPPEERDRVNFDHPETLETSLLVEHLAALRAGRAIEQPAYDFAAHRRVPAHRRVEPRPVIVVEGILILHEPALRRALDIRVFVDTDADERVLRRVERDTRERGRTVASVTAQYRETVRPMHAQFVEPSKRHADLIVPETSDRMKVATEVLLSRLREHLASR